MVNLSDILNAKILIVDDLEANVRLIERVLHGVGYTCVASTMDPHDVCKLHRNNRYDLILLDLEMPGMDGFQVMEALKEIEKDDYLPVLVITAQPDHKLRALAAGAKDFVAKPFDLVEVQTRIHNMLEVRLLHKELHNYNDVLEQHVRERTVELQAANQELEAFSYSVSHDLRAPLRSIDGFSQVLLEDYAGRLDDQGKDYLKRVRAATQRMGYLIDDMLTLSRVTRAEMRRKTVDLSALATDVLTELQKSEPGRKVDWSFEPGLIAQGDAQLLRVALVNLLGNAWKFTGKTANAKIEFGALRNAEGAMEFFVRDNGVGFDMAYAGKLFGAFQRLHLSNQFPGSGIGLATVWRIIHRHGGQVRGAGMPDQGATFYFTLPG
jgi:signal transduction histidine kinase